MPLPPELNMIPKLYHFTDVSNLLSIQAMGGLFATSLLKQLGTGFRPGGDDLSLGLDEYRGMHKYVHLCLLPNHPMEYTALKDGRINKTAWIQVNRAVLDFDGVMYCPVVSNANGAKLFPIAEAATMIDYQALYRYLDWSTAEGQQRRRDAELCEILVPDYIPINFLEIPSYG